MTRSVIVVEGPTDKVIFEALLKKIDPTLLYSLLPEVAAHFKNSFLDIFKILRGSEELENGVTYGKEAAISAFLEHISRNIFGKLILAIDLDDRGEEEIKADILSASGGTVNINGNLSYAYDNGRKKAWVLPLGMPDLKSRWNISRSAIDDYLLDLVTHEEGFDELRKHERKIKIDYKKTIDKMKEIQELMNKQKIVVDSSKALLEIFRAVSGLLVGPGTFGARVIEVADQASINKTFYSVINRLFIGMRG